MSEYLSVALNNFKSYKSLADSAIKQLSIDELFYQSSNDNNSIAIIMNHMIGNAKSRFTDFFTTDGEKPNRNRDSEFETESINPESLLQNWEDAWSIVFNLLESMDEKQLNETVTIRSEKQTALKAINRQVAHYAYHVGQIVFIAKSIKGDKWNTLSIAKGKSEEYNQKMKS